MALKFSKTQAEEFTDLLMQKVAADAALEDLVEAQPADLEAPLTAQVAAVRSEIDTIAAERQARAATENPMSRAEYVARCAPWEAELIPLLEQDGQIAGRNEMRRQRDQAALVVARAAKQDEIATLRTALKTKVKA